MTWRVSCVRTTFGGEPVYQLQRGESTFAYVLIGRTNEEFVQATRDAHALVDGANMLEKQKTKRSSA